MYKIDRNRFIYGIGIFLTIGLGLLSRKYSSLLPDLINLYLGDALWATMIYLGFATLFNSWSLKKVALIALTFSFAIEVSQLYHSPWIDAIRANRLGGLILGFGFLWSDLLAYCIGICIGALLDFLIIRFKIKNQSASWFK